MTRQQQITKQQILARMEDASRRIDSLMSEVMRAETAEEYNQSVAELVKAGSDYKTWQTVYKSL